MAADALDIVFLGANAGNFRNGFETLAPGHRIHAMREGSADAADVPRLAQADVVVTMRLAPSMPPLKRARLVHAPAAGTDAIDLACLPKGATLCNCFGHEGPIAEYVMTALLQRHVPLATADRDLRRGKWTFWSGTPGSLRTELGDQTIGLIGFGHIGQTVAARAKAFGMRVVVANRTPVPVSALVDESYGLDRLQAFMGAADAIVVSLPLTPETTGIVGVRALAAMRPDAVIINVGRGPVIDEQALYDALKSRRIGGAVIDTWYQYPTSATPHPQPAGLDFANLDNVVMTPHMSGWTHGLIRRRQQTIATNVANLAAGRDFINVVHRA